MKIDPEKTHQKLFEIPGFRLVKILGQGGFGTTYLLEDLNNQYANYVVAKVPYENTTWNIIEGDLLKQSALRGIPYVPVLYDVKQFSGTYIILMEYVDGVTIDKMLKRSGVLPVKKANDYIIKIALGLKMAHERGIVHRDIKPSNIIVEKETGNIKIIDFGIATFLTKKRNFFTHLKKHTPFYTAPEILKKGVGDLRVDIYSLGMTYYNMLTNNFPYNTDVVTEWEWINQVLEDTPIPPRRLRVDVPKYIENAILKAIAPEPENRFQSIDEFLKAIGPPRELEVARKKLAVGDTKKAEYVIRAYIQQFPEDMRGYIELATLLNRCTRYYDSIEVLKKALQICGDSPSIFIIMALTLTHLKQKEEAIKSLIKAEKTSVDPKEKKKIELLKSTLLKS